MTDLQVWVFVGIFTMAIVGVLIWQGRNYDHALRASLDGLRASTEAKFEALSAKLDGLDRKMDALARRDQDPR
jgi:hypothetical protein